MQEIKKRRIVLASVLKPVNDVRMYQKIARSLYQEGFRDLHLIGYPIPTRHTDEEGLTLHPLVPFERLSFRRLTIPWTIFNIVRSLRPTVFIVTTHELLLVALMTKVFFGSRIVYDIQENYYENIKASTGLHNILRQILATVVRLQEILLLPFFDAIWLAEKGYAEEMPFVARRAVVLENKFVFPENFVRYTLPGLNLLFSGTLARSTGVFEAIQLTEKLRARNNAVRLVIAGYCAHTPTWLELQRTVSSKPYISILGGPELLPHEEIVEAIARSHFGIVCYPKADHVRNRIPTKLYEYLACRLPIVLENRPQWVAIAATVNGCIAVDFDHPDIEKILQQALRKDFCEGPIDNFLWKTEADRMIVSINKLCQ
jgi:hypothetical protein